MAKVRGLSFSLKRAIGITAIKKKSRIRPGFPPPEVGLNGRSAGKYWKTLKNKGGDRLWIR